MKRWRGWKLAFQDEHLPEEIRILVVKHDRRRPGYGARRG